jgi:hypothetical protein
MMMNKLAMSNRHQKYLANENARLMSDAALKQVNAGLAAASILGAGVNGRNINGCNNNHTNSSRHNYNHNHHHSSHHKRNRRYRNHHSHNKSHSQHHNYHIRENNQQRCCQVNTIYSSNRKLESTHLNNNAINSQALTTMTTGSSGSRRKNTHLFATPRNNSTSTANAVAVSVAYTDSEQNEYIDDEDSAVMLPMNAANKQSKLISKENDHVLVINNGESAANVKVANNMDEYDSEMIEAG